MKWSKEEAVLRKAFEMSVKAERKTLESNQASWGSIGILIAACLLLFVGVRFSNLQKDVFWETQAQVIHEGMSQFPWKDMKENLFS